MKRAGFIWTVAALAGFAILYAPLLAVVAGSVNASRLGVSWTGFTLRWYHELFANERLWEYVRNTAMLGVCSTLIATLIGTMLAVGLDRYPWPRKLRRAIDASLQIPVVTPDILFAVGLVIAFGALRFLSGVFEPGLFTMIIGHVSFQIAFVALVVRGRIAVLGEQIEEAARDLYSSGWDLFRRVTLPLLAPGVLAGAMLAFTLSLDDFVISFMTSGPDSTTLPIYIYSSVRRGLSPEIHALSTVLLAATVVLVLALERLSGRRKISA